MIWELVKLEIRNFTVPCCVGKSREKKTHKKELNAKYEMLYAAINSDRLIDQSLMTEFYRTKHDLETLEREEAKGIILRSKCQWVEDGKKNTSYLLKLERSNYVNKLITKLHSSGEIITDPKHILDEEGKFYQKLYSNPPDTNIQEIDENCNFFLKNETIPKLTTEGRESCEDLLTKTELLKAVKVMKNGKSPGTDGLTAEFYQFFWSDIKILLLNSLDFSLSNGKLSIEQRRGILSLLPKKEKDRLYLKNWRPITLLSADYKLLAKALANRITKYLPKLVNDDQTGYIKDRYIGTNVRLI